MLKHNFTSVIYYNNIQLISIIIIAIRAEKTAFHAKDVFSTVYCVKISDETGRGYK